MSASDDLIKAVGANIQEKASLIWSAADTLRGPYKPHEYGLVILPMTVTSASMTVSRPPTTPSSSPLRSTRRLP